MRAAAYRGMPEIVEVPEASEAKSVVWTVGDAAAAYDALATLLTQPFDARTAFKIVTLARLTHPAQQRRTAAHLKHAEEMGAANPSGSFTVPAARTAEYVRAVGAVEAEVLEGFAATVAPHRLSLAAFEKANITPQHAAALEHLIRE